MTSELFQQLSKKYPPILNQALYCEITGKAKSTAEQDRLHGCGARFIRMGRAVRYRLDDVVDWLEGLPRYKSTTEADEAQREKPQG